MSYPADGGPRFVVVEVEGYLIRQGRAGVSSHGPGLSVAVLDRAYCHRTVREWCSETSRGGERGRQGGTPRERLRERIRSEADTLAIELKLRHVKRCPYCGRTHERKGARYCSAWCAKRGARHSAAASMARSRALKATRAKAQERSRVQLAYRQLAMGLDSALGVIYNPVLRKRRRKLGLLHEPE